MFDQRRMSRMGMGRPVSVHLETKPYDRNSPIVRRSLTAQQSRPGTQLFLENYQRQAKFDEMRLKRYSDYQTERTRRRKEVLDKQYNKIEKYNQWRTQQLLGTIKPPKSEPDRHIIETIQKNAEEGRLNYPALLPDDDGYVTREDPFLPNGKKKIIFNHDLPKETKAIHKQTERFFYWGC